MEDAGRIAVMTDIVGERCMVGEATMGNMCGQAGRRKWQGGDEVRDGRTDEEGNKGSRAPFVGVANLICDPLVPWHLGPLASWPYNLLQDQGLIIICTHMRIALIPIFLQLNCA